MVTIKQQVAYPVGLTVTNVRMMTKDELYNECWGEAYGGFPVVLEFNDGSKIYASSDPEGNGPGCIFGITKHGEEITVSPLTQEMINENKLA